MYSTVCIAIFVFKQKTAYDMLISDWSSDVCSSDLNALNETGRAGFVMANSAGDARGSEQLIRQRLIESGAVDVIVSVGPNFFYTVTLPCTLWRSDERCVGKECVRLCKYRLLPDH